MNGILEGWAKLESGQIRDVYVFVFAAWQPQLGTLHTRVYMHTYLQVLAQSYGNRTYNYAIIYNDQN